MRKEFAASWSRNRPFAKNTCSLGAKRTNSVGHLCGPTNSGSFLCAGSAFIGPIFEVSLNSEGTIPQFGQLTRPSMQPMTDHFANLCKRMSAATMGITLDPARAMATARYQAGKLVDGDLDGFIRECSAFCSDYVREATNSTMTGNWKRSRRSASRSRSATAKAGNAHGVRFARVPQGGDTCTFCAMLASRGFVYWSRETAGEFDHYHRNCRCLIVPDDGSGEVEGYDPDEWVQRWRDYEEIDARDDLTRAEKDHEKRLYPYMQNAVGAGYGRLYAERDLEVANCDFKLKQNQLIHIEGTAQNRIAATGRGIEPSCFTMGEEEILELIKQYAGHGTPDDSRSDGEWSRKEICTAEKVVGYVVNRKGERIPTRCFKIHYADNGVHAVPRYDDGGEPNDISR